MAYDDKQFESAANGKTLIDKVRGYAKLIRTFYPLQTFFDLQKSDPSIWYKEIAEIVSLCDKEMIKVQNGLKQYLEWGIIQDHQKEQLKWNIDSTQNKPLNLIRACGETANDLCSIFLNDRKTPLYEAETKIIYDRAKKQKIVVSGFKKFIYNLDNNQLLSSSTTGKDAITSIEKETFADKQLTHRIYKQLADIKNKAQMHLEKNKPFIFRYNSVSHAYILLYESPNLFLLQSNVGDALNYFKLDEWLNGKNFQFQLKSQASEKLGHHLSLLETIESKGLINKGNKDSKEIARIFSVNGDEADLKEAFTFGNTSDTGYELYLYDPKIAHQNLDFILKFPEEYNNIKKQSTTKSLSFAHDLSGSNTTTPVLINGQKVIFDRAVTTTPVTLEPKGDPRKSKGNIYRPY